MAHLFNLYVDPTDRTGDVLRRLFDDRLISNYTPISEQTVQVEVLNKANFLSYLNKKIRDEFDPRENIKSFQYAGETGQSAPRSKEGLVAAARKRNARFGRRTRHH